MYLILSIRTFKSLDTFKMRRNVECYDIEWNPTYMIVTDPNPNVDASMLILNRILFTDYDKHPLLREIKITFPDDCTLHNLAQLLYYFNHHYNKLFVHRRFKLTNFKKIEVNFAKVETYPNALIKPLADIDDLRQFGDVSNMIIQPSDKEYPIDQNVIEIEDFKQGIEQIESFGVIYQIM